MRTKAHRKPLRSVLSLFSPNMWVLPVASMQFYPGVWQRPGWGAGAPPGSLQLAGPFCGCEHPAKSQWNVGRLGWLGYSANLTGLGSTWGMGGTHLWMCLSIPCEHNLGHQIDPSRFLSGTLPLLIPRYHELRALLSCSSMMLLPWTQPTMD